MKQKLSILLLLITLSNYAQEKFSLETATLPRFEITDKLWPQTIGKASVCLWNDDKLAAFTLTIDDNNEQDIPYWKQLQEKYKFPFTWFVITQADKQWNVKNWKLFKELAESGNAVQGHDDRNWYEHPKKGEHNPTIKKYRKRLQATIDAVENHISNQKCSTYAYPWGEGNDSEVIKKFIAVRDVVGWPNQANQIDFKHVNSVSNPHIYGNKKDRDYYFNAILTKTDTVEGVNYYRGWLSTHFHHITSDEAHKKTDEFLQYIKKKEDKLWVATFPNVVKYAQEYATHHLKVTKNTNNEIAFSLTDGMQNKIYDFPLTVKIRIPNNWTKIIGTQNGKTISQKIVTYNHNQYALVKAIPDKGTVTLKATLDKSKPKNSPISRFESTTLRDEFYVPTTISTEAQKILRSKTRSGRNLAQTPKGDAPLKQWKKLQAVFDSLVYIGLQPIKDYYKPKIDTIFSNGIRALDIKPKNYKASDKLIFYIHGGAYVVFSPDVTLASMLPLADVSGLRIIAIDYTLAPQAKFQQMTDEVLQFYLGLLEQYDAKNIAIYGDSSGGGLAASSILKMRDKGIKQPSCLVLWSPWTDIGQVGDSYYTLADNDPSLIYENFLENAALAYAPKSEFKNPYVSPVYGDFTKEFPPTLIQVGSKEIFLSNALRMYRNLDDAKKTVKLDVYEGMWHVWQGHYRLPESKKAVENTKKFMFKYLKIKE